MIYKFKIFYTKIKALFICDKEKRREFKINNFEKYTNEERLKKKWGVSYCVFDGEELLEPSILSIMNNVDYINIVYSDKSYLCNCTNENIKTFLYNLQEKLKKKFGRDIINDIIFYEPNPKLDFQKNELKKRNLGLKYAKKAKCDYFMTMDADEFYLTDEILHSQNKIINEGITHSYCPVISYGTTPKKMKLYYITAVPFFSKINMFSRLINSKKHRITTVDPTRVINFTLFSNSHFLINCKMHHMSYIRKNIDRKFTSMNFIYKNHGGYFSNIDDSIYSDVEDIFGIKNYFDYEKNK